MADAAVTRERETFLNSCEAINHRRAELSQHARMLAQSIIEAEAARIHATYVKLSLHDVISNPMRAVKVDEAVTLIAGGIVPRRQYNLMGKLKRGQSFITAEMSAQLHSMIRDWRDMLWLDFIKENEKLYSRDTSNV